MVIHFTDGVDGDLADLQRASEKLRQEGGFWGFPWEKETWLRQAHCWAREKQLHQGTLWESGFSWRTPHPGILVFCRLPGATEWGSKDPILTQTALLPSPGTDPTGSQAHSCGGTSRKHDAFVKEHEVLIHLAVLYKLGINFIAKNLAVFSICSYHSSKILQR